MTITLDGRPKTKYGWKPDVADHRDRPFTYKVVQIPDHVDPFGMGDPVSNQGSLGSCTGNAYGDALEITLVKAGRPLVQRSRLMAYYNARVLEGTVREDSGASIRSVVKGGQKWGLAPESRCPYNIARFRIKPSNRAYVEATKVLPYVKEYQRLTNQFEISAALAEGLPVIFGFAVPEYFESAQTAKDGMVPFPQQSDKIIGGHAVVAVGYDMRGENPYFWVRNSWGRDWGIKGYFKMESKWFSHPSRLADDFWVLRA